MKTEIAKIENDSNYYVRMVNNKPHVQLPKRIIDGFTIKPERTNQTDNYLFEIAIDDNLLIEKRNREKIESFLMANNF